MKAIILAAGAGKRLRQCTLRPKCLIRIKKEPLIKRHIDCLRGVNITDITLVLGYKSKEVLQTLEQYQLTVKTLINNNFSAGSILSLWAAREEMKGEVILMDADIYYDVRLLDILAKSKKRDFFIIDSEASKDKEAVIVGFNDGRAIALARGLKERFQVSGEWVGFLKLSSCAIKCLLGIIKERVAQGKIMEGYEFIISELFNKFRISYEETNGLKWTEIDYPEDLKKARRLNIV